MCIHYRRGLAYMSIPHNVLVGGMYVGPRRGWYISPRGLRMSLLLALGYCEGLGLGSGGKIRHPTFSYISKIDSSFFSPSGFGMRPVIHFFSDYGTHRHNHP